MRVETVQSNDAASWIVGLVGTNSERFRKVTMTAEDLRRLTVLALRRHRLRHISPIIPKGYFSPAMERLRNKFLSVSLERSNEREQPPFGCLLRLLFQLGLTLSFLCGQFCFVHDTSMILFNSQNLKPSSKRIRTLLIFPISKPKD
jgi:hypothetical protein